ncbi:MAG: chemotaxis protein [Desulfovibrio sp.]|nr:MAG: chemotaxis protein [Desulfovibrio sp.]
MGIKRRLVLSLVCILLIFILLLAGLILGGVFQESDGFMAWLIVGSCCLGIGAACISLYGVLHHLFNPLNALGDYVHKVGKGNRKAELTGNFRLELGELRDAIVAMVNGLDTASQALRTSREEAERRADETQRALEEAKAQEGKSRTLLDQMQRGADKARNSSGRIFTAINELAEMTAKVSSGVELQRDRMTETATAMEEMTSTVVEIAKNASDAAESAGTSKKNAQTGAEGVREAVSSIQKVEQGFVSLKESMGELGERAANIGQIIGVINDIADQTNLLALNAAIEAARAGEAGRGFAVVADEVRKLAEKTMTATKEVESAVQSIQTHAARNVEAVDLAAEDITRSATTAVASGNYMDDIVGIVDNTAVQVESIATASEEQSQVSEEINRAVSDVTSVAGETHSHMEEATRNLLGITASVEELDSIIQGLAGGDLSSSIGDQLVQWTDALSVGVELIDGQHKVLVDLINKLNNAMKRGESEQLMLDIVNELAEYAVSHFQTEEDLFAKYGYPEAEAHARIHEQFVAKVVDFKQGLESGTAKVTMEVMRFLKDWLVQHIQGTDKKYGPFLNEHGVV